MNWEQFRAILWLRWRLTRNQLTRGSGFGAVIAALAGVILVMVALGASVGATLVGALALGKVSAMVLMFVWDGVTFFAILFSFIAVLTELQRSETIDLTRLLHLPISLRQVFVFNYLTSLVSLGTVLCLALMLGLATGLTISRGLRFVLAVPLALTFIFMLTAWIYCLRGWLLSLMVNPRRRRAIIMWITLGVIVIAQSPQLINFAVQKQNRANRQSRQAAQNEAEKNGQKAPAAKMPGESLSQFAAMAQRIHPWVPVLWLPNGARGLAAGEVLPALWGGAGMFALGCWGLSRAYRATLRFYRADDRGKPVKVKAASPATQKPVGNWIATRLPWLADDTAALALMQLRSMTRAPEVRMMLALGLFMAVFLPVAILWRGGNPAKISEVAKPFIGTLVVVMILFSLLQLVCNQFGCDRDGFRSLVLLPTPRERLLFGRNLALLPLASAIAILPLVAMSWFARLSALIAMATALQFVAAFLLFCTIGNIASILMPYRIAAGSLKPSKQSWQTSLTMMAVHLSFPLVIWVVFIPPAIGFGAEQLGWLSAAPVNLLGSLVLVGLFAALYWLTLRPLGRLLQRRETHILTAVTEVME